MIELDSYILREIGALARTIHSICDIKFKQHQLQKGQFIFLTRICEEPGISLIQLSILLRVDKTTTTKAVQKLIGEDYLIKQNDALDKRMYKLFPTAKALNIYDAVIEEENKHIAICFKDFTEDEKNQVYQLVRKMKENMESNWCELKKY